MASDELTLRVNGAAITGWTMVAVTRSVERMPSTFDVSMTERFPFAGAVIAKPGDKCEVLLGGDLVITGYVNRFFSSMEPGNHVLRISGRSMSQDVVDCSAEWPAGQIRGANALQVAQKLSAPYGISVAAAADPGPTIPQFNLNIGESAYDVIERVCRYAGLLVYDKPDGSILLAQTGTMKAASGVVEGVNAQLASFEWKDDEQFSEYSVFGLSINTSFDAGLLNQPLGTAFDQNVKRHRLRYSVAESGSAGHDLSLKRATWEAARRVGRAWKVTATVDSWRDSAGKLWEPNTLVSVSLPTIRVSAKELCLGAVTYTRDNRGTTAELVLMPRDAFLPQPVNLLPILRDDVPSSLVPR